jgi:hypothetical protein
LSKVPENTLKFVVGVMLTSFGLFWGAEGVGARWPGSDAALLIIAPALLIFCLLLTMIFRNRRPTDDAKSAQVPVTAAPAPAGGAAATATLTNNEPGTLTRFGLFWYDFVIGGVVLLLVITGLASGWALAWLIPVVAVALLIPYGMARAARS